MSSRSDRLKLAHLREGTGGHRVGDGTEESTRWDVSFMMPELSPSSLTDIAPDGIRVLIIVGPDNRVDEERQVCEGEPDNN
jgi:hypothetical protein